MIDDTLVINEAYIEITGVDMTLKGDDPFGAVKSGIITVRSKSLILCNIPSPLHQHEPISIGGLESSHVCWDYKDYSAKGLSNPILILPIGIASNAHTCIPPSAEDPIGLLLKRNHKENGQYERVGCFKTWYPTNQFYQLMNLAQDEQFEALGISRDSDNFPSKKDYVSTDVDEDGITWYTITIA